MIRNIETGLKWNGEDAKIKMDRVVVNSVFKGGILVESQAAALCPVDEGRLRGSITTQTKYNEHIGKPSGLTEKGDILNKPTQDNVALVGTNLKYGVYVEYGTGAHYPPIEALKKWAAKVLGDEKLAYAIQKKIGMRGTKAQPFMRPAIDLYKGGILTVFTIEGKKEFKEYF